MEPRYKPGDRVLVLQRNQPGHVRTPMYVRGKTGVIERIVGAFPNPELLAYGHSGMPYKTLYRVNFRQDELWSDYDGPSDDTLEIEIYEHWLSPA
jgi:hypothetical protein